MRVRQLGLRCCTTMRVLHGRNIFFFSNVYCTILTFFFFFFFLLSIIGFIFLHAGLKFSIVDLKKKLLELCKSCAKNIIIIFLENVRFTTSIQQLYNNLSHEGGSYILESTLMCGVVVQLLYWCCTRIKSLIFYGPEIMTTRKKKRDLIHTQHHHNNHTTTPHMRVGPSVWGPPSCEGLLCDCCVGVVNLTFSKRKKVNVGI
jgi:hypothetical protein